MTTQASNSQECPVCAFPLRPDLFCEKCQRVPEFPSPSFVQHDDQPKDLGPKTIIVKKYEFLEVWRDQVESVDDVNEITKAAIREVLSIDYDNISAFESLFRTAEVILENSHQVQKIVVEPSQWDRSTELGPDRELRIWTGTFFGLFDSAKYALKIVMALLAPSAEGWRDIIREGGTVAYALYKIYDSFIILSGNDEIVFELIAKKVLNVVNYDMLQLRSLERGEAFGLIGPTTEEIEEMLSPGISSTEVRDILLRLVGRKIIIEQQGRWYIKI